MWTVAVDIECLYSKHMCHEITSEPCCALVRRYFETGFNYEPAYSQKADDSATISLAPDSFNCATPLVSFVEGGVNAARQPLRDRTFQPEKYFGWPNVHLISSLAC